jgi:hypothetical protein
MPFQLCDNLSKDFLEAFPSLSLKLKLLLESNFIDLLLKVEILSSMNDVLKSNNSFFLS